MFSSEIYFWKLLTLGVVIIVFKLEFTGSVSHQSHLCEAKDMPCEGGNGGQCRMKYYKLNSTGCRDLVFSGDLTPPETILGKIRIRSYHYNLKSYRQTAFNLSFTNINWDHMKFRFKQEGNEMKNTCREFFKLTNTTLGDFFYDCLWSNENYEGKIFNFEYEVTKESMISYKKYSFKVPFAKNIDETTNLSNWEILILVEMVKNSFGLTTFIVHWQPLPERFSVNTYNLSVYSNDSGQTELVYFTNVTCSTMDTCKYYYNKWYGNVQFGVQPFCGNESSCFISKTIIFVLGGVNARPLLIGIVSVTLVVPATIYGLYLLRNYLIRKSKKWIYPVPKLLVIFTPSLSFHVSVVFALVDYLKTYCNIEPLVDELHIYYSKSKDPFKWCNEAFKSANSIMVVASPYHKHLRAADSVYKNTDVLLLRLLQEHLATRESKIQIFVLMLPYCSEKDIPDEAFNVRRFYFPQDLDKILRFIHKVSGFVDCLLPEVQGGKEIYKVLGTKLSNAIADAERQLKKNKLEYERMVEEVGKKEGIQENETANVAVRRGVMRSGRVKKAEMELASEVFRDFPGHLDEMNLSGEETESLIGFQEMPIRKSVVDLDALDL